MTGHDPFELDRRQIKQSFERAADTYDAAAALQREVCDRLAERLDYVKLAPARVLDLGCGTGQGVELLRRRYRNAHCLGLDLAESMLRATAGRFGWWRRPSLLCASADHLPLADASVDLVFSSMTFQWCPDLDRLFAEVRRVLRPGGLVLFSTCGPDSLAELRQAWAQVDGYTHTSRFVDMHDVGDAMVRAGLADPVLDVERMVTTYPSVKALMRDLKAIGAHNVTAGRPAGLTGRRRFEAVRSAYPQRPDDGRFPMSWEIVFGLGWSVAPREQAVVRFQPGRG